MCVSCLSIGRVRVGHVNQALRSNIRAGKRNLAIAIQFGFKVKRLRSYRGGEEDKVLRWSCRTLGRKKSG